MNVAVNPHWAALKAHGVKTLGHQHFAEFLRFAAHSTRSIGPEGMAEHFDFAAKQIELEGKRLENRL